MISKTLGHYQITQKLGEGGMGVAYKARDTNLDRFAALKVLPPEKVSDPDRKRRFIQKARAASAPNHPDLIHVCHVCHVHRSEGTDSTTREHFASEVTAKPIGDKRPLPSEMSWSRPHV